MSMTAGQVNKTVVAQADRIRILEAAVADVRREHAVELATTKADLAATREKLADLKHIVYALIGVPVAVAATYLGGGLKR